MNTILEVRNLKKSFGDTPVLRGIDLAVGRGEVHTIIGRSGSGKSTLLRCLNLLESADEGDIRLHGEDLLDKHVPAHRRRQGTGMVFQQFNLFLNLSIFDNCLVGLQHVKKMPRREAAERVLSYLTMVDMAPYRDARPRQLSGGQQQRAAIARALCLEPDILLFDEPTSALDPELVGEVVDVIAKLAESGQTMVLVTHEMDVARGLSDHVVYMDEGRIVEEGPPAQIFEQPTDPRTRTFLSRYHESPRGR